MGGVEFVATQPRMMPHRDLSKSPVQPVMSAERMRPSGKRANAAPGMVYGVKPDLFHRRRKRALGNLEIHRQG